MLIIITWRLTSSSARGSPVFTKNKYSRSFDLCSEIKIFTENSNDSDSVSSLGDRKTGLDPDSSGTDSPTVGRSTPQLDS